MAPALQTTKRKFYKLLDGLNTSSHSLSGPRTAASTNATDDGPDPKRTRVSIGSARAVSVTRHTSARLVGSGGTIATRKFAKPKSGNAITAPRPIPNYQPYSQEAFLDRLKTFSDVKLWTYKPSDISELEWAKRGWICDGQVDLVACKGGCEARVVVRLARGKERAKAFGEDEVIGDKENRPEMADGVSEVLEDAEPEWMIDADETLVRRYRDLIVAGHHNDCLWKKAGCKDDIYRIRMGDQTTWQAELTARYASLMTIRNALPDHIKLPDFQSMHNHNPASFAIEPIRSTLTSLVGLASTSASGDKNTSDSAVTENLTTNHKEEMNTMAATLALFGWGGSSPHKIHLASCSRCFQRIGLWLYSSDPSNKALPAAQSGIADDDVLQFDIVGLHRDHCPWINAETQAGLSQFKGLAAWEILVRMIEAREAISRKADAQIAEDPEGLWDSFDNQPRPYAEVEAEDRARVSKLARLKRAFTFRKDVRKSWRSSKDSA